MKKAIYFLAICLALSGCKAFQPSANLNHFSSYFVAPIHDSITPIGQLKVTFFGNSTLLFDNGKSQIMVDGFFTRPSVSKVAFGKVRSNEKLIKTIIQQYHLERLQAIFVCHSHYDHAMDAPLLSKLTGAKLYGSSSTLNLGKGEKLADDAMRLFEPGKKISIGDYLVTIVNSKHTPPFKLFGKSNATDPNHPNIDAPLRQPAHAEKYIEGGTFDVYIEHNNKRFLIKASTNYLAGALQSYPCDVLFLGTTMLGIQPADFQQQYYDETVKATGAKMVIPIHWDNFMHPLSKPVVALPNISDNVEAGLQFLLHKTKAEHIDFRLLQKESSILF